MRNVLITMGLALSQLLGGISNSLAEEIAAKTIVGSDQSQAMSSFTLSNNYGKSIALREFADKPIVVLTFLGTECPLAKLYGPRLNAIHDKYAERGVVLVGVSSNKQDSLTELTAYVHRYDIRFPILKDVGNRLADEFGATRTPEVFVLDAQRKVCYHGRIDDQYGVGYSKEKSSESDLSRAIDEMLAGKPVSKPETAAIGCIIGRVKDIPTSGDVTFTQHIAPLLNARCVQCHRPGEIGPFTLTSYRDVLGWEDTILEVIADNRMPPWNANPDIGHFKNDARLSEDEKQLLRNWIANGMPEGDAANLPEPPKFVEGWRIPEPDQVFAMHDSAFSVPAEGVVNYQHFKVDPGWTEDKYIYAAEARPDNRGVVHHILVYVIPPGERDRDSRTALVGYAPGSLPVMLSDGLAMRVAAGSQLLFQMHYTPNGSPQTDKSYVGVCFTTADKVTKLVQGRAALERDFHIPPGASEHQVVAKYQSRNDELLLSMTPHMHLRGKSFRYEATYPDGQREILLDVPKYDFNWQLKYILSEPKLLPKGTKLVCTALYDNSEANLANPDPARTVSWGDQSFEEMMIGFFDTVPPDNQ